MNKAIHHELSTEYDTLFLLHHRSKNQHRQQRWYKYLNTTVRKLRKILKLQHDITRLPAPSSRAEFKIKQMVGLAEDVLALSRDAYWAYAGIIELAQFLSLGFALIASLAKITLLLQQIPGVKPLPKRIRSLEEVCDGPVQIEEEDGEEEEEVVDVDVDVEYAVWHRFGKSRAELLEFKKNASFLTGVMDREVTPIGGMPMTLGTYRDLVLSGTAPDIFTVTSQSVDSASDPSFKRREALYILPAALTTTITDDNVREYMTEENIHYDQEDQLWVSPEVWCSFKQIMPEIFAVVSEATKTNSFSVTCFPTTLIIDDTPITRPNDLEITPENKFNVMLGIHTRRRQWKAYKTSILMKLTNTYPYQAMKYIWKHFIADFMDLDTVTESHSEETVDFGELLFFEVTRWHLQRRAAVLARFDIAEQELNSFMDAIALKVKHAVGDDEEEFCELEEATSKAAACKPPGKLLGRKLRRYVSEYRWFMDMDLRQEIRIVEEPPEDGISSQEIISYAQANNYEIGVGKIKVSSGQWRELLSYTHDIFARIESDPRYKVDEFVPDLSLSSDEIAHAFITHRKRMVNKMVGRPTVIVLYKYVMDCVVAKYAKLELPPFEKLDIDLDYEVSLEFYCWVMAREKYVTKELRRQELNVILEVDRAAARCRAEIIASLTPKRRHLETGNTFTKETEGGQPGGRHNTCI
ncbi:hypothetical protein Cantr_10728 [Candida viswanathii]|uniref:RNase MRP protein 1 RNA binding domain-containing protein n=1 Tax=Candida viswanathii TaxID=5486 RepID=A0A367YGD8_9ASCO|nr:hypothetical protein Cantr_10728 [Candida viswanathii]